MSGLYDRKYAALSCEGNPGQQVQRNSWMMEDIVSAGMSKTMVRNSRQYFLAGLIILYGNKITKSMQKLFRL